MPRSLIHTPRGVNMLIRPRTVEKERGGLEVDASELEGLVKLDAEGVTSTVPAPVGDVVGTTDTQTLTGKTISGGTNTLQAIGVASLTSGAATAGQILTADGAGASVYETPAPVDTLPDQTWHSGEFLTTDGADASWAAPTVAGVVLEADYNAHTILAATADDTPAALTVGEQTVVGRATGGNIAALTAAQISTLMGHSSKAKTADTTRNNTDVYAADDHLVSFALEASSYYAFMGKLTVTDSGTNDYKVQLVGNQNYTGSGTVQLGTVNAKDVDVSAGTTMTFGQINVTSGNAIAHFSGWIYTNTAVSIDVEWAQFFASAANTTLLRGSCFEFHKIAQV